MSTLVRWIILALFIPGLLVSQKKSREPGPSESEIGTPSSWFLPKALTIRPIRVYMSDVYTGSIPTFGGEFDLANLPRWKAFSISKNTFYWFDMLSMECALGYGSVFHRGKIGNSSSVYVPITLIAELPFLVPAKQVKIYQGIDWNGLRLLAGLEFPLIQEETKLKALSWVPAIAAGLGARFRWGNNWSLMPELFYHRYLSSLQSTGQFQRAEDLSFLTFGIQLSYSFSASEPEPIPPTVKMEWQNPYGFSSEFTSSISKEPEHGTTTASFDVVKDITAKITFASKPSAELIYIDETAEPLSSKALIDSLLKKTKLNNPFIYCCVSNGKEYAEFPLANGDELRKSLSRFEIQEPTIFTELGRIETARNKFYNPQIIGGPMKTILYLSSGSVKKIRDDVPDFIQRLYLRHLNPWELELVFADSDQGAELTKQIKLYGVSSTVWPKHK